MQIDDLERSRREASRGEYPSACSRGTYLKHLKTEYLKRNSGRLPRDGLKSPKPRFADIEGLNGEMTCSRE